MGLWSSTWTSIGALFSAGWENLTSGNVLGGAAQLLGGVVFGASAAILSPVLGVMNAVDSLVDYGTSDEEDTVVKTTAAVEHNRAAYKAQAELASLQLNESQRSDAIAAFQQRSASEAALGGSGLVGGTPFWAAKMGADENLRRIKSSFTQGMLQLEGLQEDAAYNETVLGIDLDAAQRDLDWAPITTGLQLLGIAAKAYTGLSDLAGSEGLSFGRSVKSAGASAGIESAATGRAAFSTGGILDVGSTGYTPSISKNAPTIGPAFQASKSPLSWGNAKRFKIGG